MQVRVEKPTVLPLLKTYKVAAYARVSVETEMSEHSLENQIEYYSSYIKSNPAWSFVGVYADEGLTGTKVNRPGFQNLIKDCEAGIIDIVLVKSISRFARNTVDLLNVTRRLKELGINIWFEKENINSISSEGELLLTLLASFAQEESRSVSENNKWAVRKRFEQGIGNTFFMYGYKWDGKEFHIVPEQAAIVKEIYSSYLSGMSPDQIANSLKARGVKSTRGKDFTYSLVCGILRLEKYTGDSLFQKWFSPDHLTKRHIRNTGELPMFYAEGTNPVIIDKETFNAVQDEIKRRQALGYLANQSISFSCFTHKVFCGKCGHTYRRRIGSKKGRITIQHKWVCGTRISGTSKACDGQNIPEKALYMLTYEVLGTDQLTKELFDSQIEKIVVSGPSTLTFHMKDGTTINKQWLVTTPNKTQREKINGKISNADSSN